MSEFLLLAFFVSCVLAFIQKRAERKENEEMKNELRELKRKFS